MFFSHTWDPMTDMPSMSGKVVIVTGGNSGLGRECVKHLAAHGAKVINDILVIAPSFFASRARILPSLARLLPLLPHAFSFDMLLLTLLSLLLCSRLAQEYRGVWA